jgi:hypothetical protein
VVLSLQKITACTLEAPGPDWHHPVVNLSRFAWLLLTLPFLAGCETTYTRLRVTNPRGELIADWVARGYVWRTEEGYRITALERTDGRPYPKTTYYPDGWRTTVVGPYVRRWRCAKPGWLDGSIGR